MPKLPRIPSILVVRVLKRVGFYIHHQTGSHVHLRHPYYANLRVVVPVTKKDIKPKTLKSIIEQAGMAVDEFINFL